MASWPSAPMAVPPVAGTLQSTRTSAAKPVPQTSSQLGVSGAITSAPAPCVTYSGPLPARLQQPGLALHAAPWQIRPPVPAAATIAMPINKTRPPRLQQSADAAARAAAVAQKLQNRGAWPRAAGKDPSAFPEESLRGPHRYCNWLVPGRICIGVFPCLEVWRRDGEAAYRRDLAALADAGISFFACLDDGPFRVNQAMQQPLYLSDLPEGWQGEAKIFATQDGSIFAWSTLLECLEAVAAHLEEPSRGPCYIHCFGGHGRAGIVAACLLGLGYGLPAASALAATKRAHDCRDNAAWPLSQTPPSPQTAEQCEQVTALLDVWTTSADLVLRPKCP